MQYETTSHNSEIPPETLRLIPQVRIARLIGRRHETVHRWLKGKNRPGPESIRKMKEAGIWEAMRALIGEGL